MKLKKEQEEHRHVSSLRSKQKDDDSSSSSAFKTFQSSSIHGKKIISSSSTTTTTTTSSLQQSQSHNRMHCILERMMHHYHWIFVWIVITIGIMHIPSSSFGGRFFIDLGKNHDTGMDDSTFALFPFPNNLYPLRFISLPSVFCSAFIPTPHRSSYHHHNPYHPYRSIQKSSYYYLYNKHLSNSNPTSEKSTFPCNTVGYSDCRVRSKIHHHHHHPQRQQHHHPQQQMPCSWKERCKQKLDFRQTSTGPSSFSTALAASSGEHDQMENNQEENNNEKNTDQQQKISKKSTKREKYLKAPIRKAVQKFKARPGTYLLIPCVAAIVGWFTNWLAVQMIFYPIRFLGIPLYRVPEVPLGFIGWQGIVPCKTKTMTEAMVHMITTQLLSTKEIFQRLDVNAVANLLTPSFPLIAQEVVEDMLKPTTYKWMGQIPSAVVVGFPTHTKEMLNHLIHRFFKDFIVAMRNDVDSFFNIRNCVVNQMLEDKAKLGELFRKCGQKELNFLTNSGLFFGFFLGLIQMVVALFWDNPWSLSFGGGIVGMATNWLALKWIFEPVNPTKVGPFILQGQFLRRQKEVAKEFSDFFASKILTSDKMWNSILNDPETNPAFRDLFTKHFLKLAGTITAGFKITPEPEVLKNIASRAVDKIPNHIGVIHSLVDKQFNMRETLRVSMEGMTSAQFERVLHPIFEEDELTLVLAGAALGFAAGLVQQGIETGKIQLPQLKGLKLSKCGQAVKTKLCCLKKRTCLIFQAGCSGTMKKIQVWKKRLRNKQCGSKVNIDSDQISNFNNDSK